MKSEMSGSCELCDSPVDENGGRCDRDAGIWECDACTDREAARWAKFYGWKAPRTEAQRIAQVQAMRTANPWMSQEPDNDPPLYQFRPDWKAGRS